MVYRIKAAIVMNRPADAEVVEVVNMVRLCQTFNTLPLPGGLLDQDAYQMYLFTTVLESDQERAAIEEARAKTKVH